jgi:hypothetical protein
LAFKGFCSSSVGKLGSPINFVNCHIVKSL